MSRLARSSTTPTTHQFTELTAQTVLGALTASAGAPPYIRDGGAQSSTAGKRHTSGARRESRGTRKRRRCATPARKATTSEQWSGAPG
jgi:hypothetical protein